MGACVCGSCCWAEKGIFGLWCGDWPIEQAGHIFFEREKSAKFVLKTRRRRGVSKGFEREYFMIMKDYITHFCILIRKAPKVFILRLFGFWRAHACQVATLLWSEWGGAVGERALMGARIFREKKNIIISSYPVWHAIPLKAKF